MIELIATQVRDELKGRPIPHIEWEFSRRIDKMIDAENWSVYCGVTGARIRLTDLRYWNVEKQIAYAGPELVRREDFLPKTQESSTSP